MAVFGPFGVLFKPCFSAKVDTFCPPARKKVYLLTCTLPTPQIHVAKCPKNKKSDISYRLRHVGTICSRCLFSFVYMLWGLYSMSLYSDIRVSSPSEIRLPSQSLRSTILSGYTARQVAGDHSRRSGFLLCPTEEH